MENSLQLPTPTKRPATKPLAPFLGLTPERYHDCAILFLKVIALVSATVFVILIGLPVFLGVLVFLIATPIMIYLHLLGWKGFQLDFDERANPVLIWEDLNEGNS